MKISIITVAYNSASTIEDTIRSVLLQDYSNIEYIIVDGQSTDGTLDIINRYRDRIAKVVSEKDSSYYDALNKGIRLATGDVITALNSDDMYATPDIITNVAYLFDQSQAQAVYGDLVLVDKLDIAKVIRYWQAGDYRVGMFKQGWMPPHPTFFVKKECLQNYGDYLTSFKYSADYELMLRFIHKHQISVAYLPRIMVKMRVGGLGNTNLLAKIKANAEDRKAWKINGLSGGWLASIMKPLSKLQQFYKKPNGSRD